MPALAVTPAGWVTVSRGSTTASVGPEADVADAGLDLEGQDVEHADRRALGTGARRRRHRDEWQQRAAAAAGPAPTGALT